MSLTIEADSIESISTGLGKRISLTVEGGDIQALLDEIGAEKIVKNFDVDLLLEAIGQEAAAKYFGLVEVVE